MDTRIIDSRDLVARLAELEDEDAELDEDEIAERDEIRELAEYVEDWQYGATLIRDDQFEDYARELADDIGAISQDAAWPLSYIDWAAAADALKQDYTEVEYLGSTYYVR